MNPKDVPKCDSISHFVLVRIMIRRGVLLRRVPGRAAARILRRYTNEPRDNRTSSEG